MLTLLTLLCTVCCVVVFPLVPPVVPPFCLLATACSMMESKLLRKSREINKVSTSAHKRRRRCPEDDPKDKEREGERKRPTFQNAKKKKMNTKTNGGGARSSPGIHVRPHVLLFLVLVATEPPKLAARHFREKT